jgi:Zn finger protein HypA/HybF involved in hydrogenase expression
MHEFGVAAGIIRGLLEQLRREKVSNVTEVRFRRSSAFSEAVLRQTFAALSVDTPLDGALLVVDVAVLSIACGCGHSNEVNSGDLVGHMYICPHCGAVREIAEAHDLELMEVIAEDSLNAIDL